jgi:NRAMP (natural resistance-associated macrophage protein)-like metal ion transporter
MTHQVGSMAPKEVVLAARPDVRRSELTVTATGRPSGWKAYLRAFGPGLVTGSSDDDPSGIATYAQGGAKFGLGLVWAALVTLPLMAAVQETCDRTALATGKGLGELIVERYHSRGRRLIGTLIAALIAANAFNVAADLVAVGSGMHLLHAGPTAAWALAAGLVTTGLLVSGSFERIAQVFKFLCLSLVAYVVVLFLVHPRWGDVLRHLVVPHVRFEREYLSLLVAFFGTTISPYLFFWQSAHRVEEMREENDHGDLPVPLGDRPPGARKQKLRTSRVDVFAGMTFSNLVMFAIIVATASTIAGHGHPDIESAAHAADTLRPLAGRFAATIFALGFIGTGMLAIPVLAASGAVGMSGLLGQRWGFSRSLRQAPVFYGLLVAGTIGGTALSLLHINPIRLLVLSALVNGVAASPLLFVIMRVASDPAIMGEERNGRLANLLGWITVAIMASGAVALIVTALG